MKKTIEIMAVLVGAGIVLIMLFNVFFGIRAFAVSEIAVNATIEEEVEIPVEIYFDEGYYMCSFKVGDLPEVNIPIPDSFGSYPSEELPNNLDKMLNIVPSYYIDDIGIEEVMLSGDETIAMKISVGESNSTDIDDMDEALVFDEVIVLENPYIMSYYANHRGVEIQIDFAMLPDVSQEQVIYFKDMAHKVVSSVYISEDDLDRVIGSIGVEADADGISVNISAIFAFMVNMLIFVSIYRMIRKTSNRRKSAQEYGGGYQSADYRQSPPFMRVEKDIEMDYDHCEEDNKKGVSYMGNDMSRYQRDYSEYSYGIKMDKEDKRRKQEQYKSLLDSGMIERDEYREKMNEINRLYK